MDSQALLAMLLIVITSIAGMVVRSTDKEKWLYMDKLSDAMSDTITNMIDDLDGIVKEKKDAKDADEVLEDADLKTGEDCADDKWPIKTCQNAKMFCFQREDTDNEMVNGYKKRLQENCHKTCGYCQPNANVLLTDGQTDKEMGKITFKFDKDKGCMSITGTVSNLSPAARHGFHIHKFGNIIGGCGSTAGHYNPEHKDHGNPLTGSHHVGDLGNIRADDKGVAIVDMCVKFVHTEGNESVIGRAVVVHKKEDDLGTGGKDDSKTTGHADGRAACGVIGVTKTTF